MARENQGLQIALIIFVVITIALGVGTYVLYRSYDEANTKAKTSQAAESKNLTLANKNQDDLDKLKRLLGVAKTETADGIEETLFKEDMKKYGVGYPEEFRFYRPLLEKMQNTINEKNIELADAKTELQKLSDQYAVREKNKDPQLKRFEEERDKAQRDLAGEQTKFKGERDRLNQDQSKLSGDLQNYRKEAEAKVAKVETQRQKYEERAKKLGDHVDEQAQLIQKLTKVKVEAPAGEVLWVNQRNGAVWINLGRADALPRQVSFSVYPADMHDMTLKGKKGSIEVTQILGTHLAEARVLDDKMSDPIVPGDKIDTPLWSPNLKRHFALAGLMDLDGDGRSDLQTMLNLIEMNGGVVDCYISDNGKDKYKQVGEVTVNTNCLILGEAPTEKGDPGQLSSFTKILRDATQLRIPSMQLGDMLIRMGWKNLSPVIRYGRGANPDDFRAKPDDSRPSGGMYHRL